MARDPKNRKEWHDQVDLVKWAMAKAPRHPELALLHHVPNGEHRVKAVAGKLRALGVKAGVPDLFLPVGRRGWHGLYIELKRWPNPAAVSESQRWWLRRLRVEYYMTLVCHGWGEGADCLSAYLGIYDSSSDEKRREATYARCVGRAEKEAAKK